MLRSLQESVDGEERELESSEEGGGLPEERKPERSSNSYHCLYGYRGSGLHQGSGSDVGSPSKSSAETSSDDFSLSLVDTNLPTEAEMELRGLVAKHLNKGALFEGMGNVISVELRLELDGYIQDMKTYLDSKQSNLETCIQPRLRTWFEDLVCPIQRVVKFFQEKLAFVLHAALSCTPVEVNGSEERTEKDINRFLRAASLQDLVRESMTTSLCTAAATEDQCKSVVIDLNGPQLCFHGAGTNRFCEDWTQAFLNVSEGGNPFLFRQMLENFKLKAIQDINNLKRFIRQAEMSHYALFKCYLFLKNSGSGDVLLKIVKVEYAEVQEARNVISVLEEFMRDQLGA
uniref:Chromosome 17 open reading frame 75 n=1 Tax=Naja naja TaxID=35670 RepID=A0A8C6VKB8_NAJNA